jgi:hypothetical protein
MSRLHRRLNGSDELRADRLQLDVVPNLAGEGGYGDLGVIPSTVEASIH